MSKVKSERISGRLPLPVKKLIMHKKFLHCEFSYKNIPRSLDFFCFFPHWQLDTTVILGYINRFVFIRKNCCFYEAEYNKI